MNNHYVIKNEFLKEFLRFIKNKNLYHIFIYNVKKTNDELNFLNYIINPTTAIYYKEPDRYIVNAFIWNISIVPHKYLDEFNVDTTYSFWSILNEEWNEIREKLINEKLKKLNI